MTINPAEVVGAGESAQMREINRRFKPLGQQCVELVKVTESAPEDAGVPEFMKDIGRQLLQIVAQYQKSIVAWGDDTEPEWWTAGYEEEYDEEPEGTDEPENADEEPAGKYQNHLQLAIVVYPPPARKPVIVNFSKPPQAKMVDAGKQAAISDDQINELENKASTKVFVDDLLSKIQGGLANLKKAVIPPKPVVTDPFGCAFNIELLNERRAIEGLHDEPEGDDDWDDDNWDD